MDHTDKNGSKANGYVNLSPTKRSLEPDPDYEDAVVAPNAKRLKQLEENALVDAQVKVRSILENQFNDEIKRRNQEIDEIQHRITVVKSQLHFVRYASAAVYYSGKQLHVTPSTTPFIHPAVKSHLGKKPRAWETEESKATHSIALPTSEKVEMPVVLESNDRTQYKPPIQPELPTSVRGSRYKAKRRIVVGNVSKWIPLEERTDNASHKWMVYVRGSQSQPDISDVLKSVRFFLHPSYIPNDVVEVKAPPFHLTRRGWGEFPLRAQLHFHNPLDKPIDIVHHLKLDRSCSGLQMLGAETIVDAWIHEKHAELDTVDSGTVTESMPQRVEIESETIDPSLDENRTIIEDSALLEANNSGVLRSSLAPAIVSIKKEPGLESDDETKQPEPCALLTTAQIKQEPVEEVVTCLPPSNGATPTSNATTLAVKNARIPTSAAAANQINLNTITCLNKDGKVVQLPLAALQKILSGAKVLNGSSVQIRAASPATTATPQIIRLAKPPAVPLRPVIRSPSAAASLAPQQQSLLKPKILLSAPVRNLGFTTGIKLVNCAPSAPSVIQNSGNGTGPQVKYVSVRLPSSLQNQPAGLVGVRNVAPISNPVSLLATNGLMAGANKKSVVDAALTQALGQDAKYKEHKAKLQYILDQVAESGFTSIACAVRFLLAKIPLVTIEAQDYLYRQIRPFTAPSLEVFVSWTIGKQRASEMTRAKLIREALLKTGLKDVWSTKEIMIFARRHGYSPLCTWKPKPEKTDIESEKLETKPSYEVSSLSEVTDIEQQLTIEGQKSSSDWSDSVEIDVEGIDEGQSSCSSSVADSSKKSNLGKAQPKIFMQSKEDDLGRFVTQEMKKQGISFWPEEIETSVWHDTAKFVLKHIWRHTAEDLVRRSLSHVFQRTAGRIPESIELDDAVMAVRSRPEFDCLTNQGLGVRMEPGAE